MGKNVPKYLLQIFREYFICIATVKLLQSSRFLFRLFSQTTIIEIPSLNQYEKVKYENCGTQTTKLNLARHKKSCYDGTMYYTQCSNFSTKSQNDLHYHIAKKLIAPEFDVTFKC